MKDIEKLYSGGASKGNGEFFGEDAEEVLHYDNPIDAERLIAHLKEDNFTKIHIDENCIVGWAIAFYKAVPSARKEDFLGDDTGKHKTIGKIRHPLHYRMWTERARIMKSADGADRYNQDVISGNLMQYLLKCLLFTCLEMQNHMRTFTGSDGRFYRNELCLDGTNGETFALRDIKGLAIGEKEAALLKQWDTVLSWAKRAENYNPALTYGVYQIYAKLDTSHVDGVTGSTVWDNVELHTALAGLKTLVKDYYNSDIVPMLFEYEYLK